MRKTNVSRSLVVGGAVLIAAILAAPFQAQAVEDKLVIVTSYPKDLTSVFKKAFEKKYPGTKVEMLKKKTTAGIKYIQETSKNNRSDMFWASAPDAFEVLKGDGLLQKYQVKAKGIPKMVGAFPINDPRYVVLALLDEPKGTKATHGYATGGWVAAPVVRRVVERMAPMLGMPKVEEDAPGMRELETYVAAEGRRLASY